MPRSALRRVLIVPVVLGSCLAASDPPVPDLMTLYLRAVEFDPAFQAARSERLIADLGLREAKAGMYPLFWAEASTSYTIQDIRSSDNVLFTPGETDYYGQHFLISLNQPLIRTSAFRRIDEAHAGVRQATWTYAAAESELMVRVAEAYLGFLAMRDSLDLAVAEREAIGRQREEAEERLQLGLAKITDVQDARGRYALAQAEEINARDTLEESRQAIAEITREAPDAVKVLSEGLPLVPPDNPDVERWVEAAGFQNPRVRALQAAVEVARESVRRQRATYYPTLDLVARYDDTDTGGTIFGGGNAIDNQVYELRMAIPIFDGGKTPALVATAGLKQNVAEQELEKARRNVDRLTRASFQGVVSGITRVESLRESVFAHEAALVAKEEGWRAGVSAALAVLDARRELYRSKRDLARARYLYILDSLKLKNAVGILVINDLDQINAYLQ